MMCLPNPDRPTQGREQGTEKETVGRGVTGLTAPIAKDGCDSQKVRPCGAITINSFWTHSPKQAIRWSVCIQHGSVSCWRRLRLRKRDPGGQSGEHCRAREMKAHDMTGLRSVTSCWVGTGRNCETSKGGPLGFLSSTISMQTTHRAAHRAPQGRPAPEHALCSRSSGSEHRLWSQQLPAFRPQHCHLLSPGPVSSLYSKWG